ncbi:hypothetical protein L1887_49541 [Cichorium endivia]|nr:hypothetical protein L1887_49541 [Cichorium endivia]
MCDISKYVKNKLKLRSGALNQEIGAQVSWSSLPLLLGTHIPEHSFIHEFVREYMINNGLAQMFNRKRETALAGSHAHLAMGVPGILIAGFREALDQLPFDNQGVFFFILRRERSVPPRGIALLQRYAEVRFPGGIEHGPALPSAITFGQRDSKVDLNAYCGGEYGYLITVACKFGDADDVILLLENGANPNPPLSEPLVVAVLCRDAKNARILLQYGAGLDNVLGEKDEIRSTGPCNWAALGCYNYFSSLEAAANIRIDQELPLFRPAAAVEGRRCEFERPVRPDIVACSDSSVRSLDTEAYIRNMGQQILVSALRRCC